MLKKCCISFAVWFLSQPPPVPTSSAVCVACVWEPLIQRLMKSASAPSPLLPPSLFLWVSGSWIMKHDLRRLPGDHRWGGKADYRRLSVQCERMQSVHSAACPSAPVHLGWCQVKTMASWTVSSCMLTGVNIAHKRQHAGGFKYYCTEMSLPCRPLPLQRKTLRLIPRKPESPWKTNDDSFDCIWKQKWSSATEPPVMKVINDCHLPASGWRDWFLCISFAAFDANSLANTPKQHLFCSESSPGGTGTLLSSMWSHHLRNNAAASASSFCHGSASLDLMKTSKAETGVAAMCKSAAPLSQFASSAFE